LLIVEFFNPFSSTHKKIKDIFYQLLRTLKTLERYTNQCIWYSYFNRP